MKQQLLHDKLSAEYAADFSDFMASCGIDESSITAAHKLTWLTSVLDSRAPQLTWATFYGLSRALGNFTPENPEETATQSLLCSAFATGLRYDRRFKPPLLAVKPMPDDLFIRVIQELKTTRIEPVRWQRTRTALKLIRSSGIFPDEVREVRPSWLERAGSGYLLHVEGTGHNPRTIPIPPLSNPDLCPVRDLNAWLALAPKPNSRLFPRIDPHSQIIRWNEPMTQDLHLRLKTTLHQLGEHERWGLLSIQLSFRRRCSEHFSEPMAVYLSGLYDAKGFWRSLRRVPKWSKA